MKFIFESILGMSSGGNLGKYIAKEHFDGSPLIKTEMHLSSSKIKQMDK